MRLKMQSLIASISLSLTLIPGAANADAPDAQAAPSPDDLLGNMVVVAGASQSLPKIAVAPSLAWDEEDVVLRSVVRRDLDLSGEFELLDDERAPQIAWNAYQPDSPSHLSHWAKTGVEAVVRLSGRPAEKGQAELFAQVFLVGQGENAVFEERITTPAPAVRLSAHRLADRILGALTGHKGGFASRMTFASGSGKQRRVFVIDADGHEPTAISPAGGTAIAPAFGKQGELFYAMSSDGGEYQVYSAVSGLVPLPFKASVYGIAFNKDRSRVALSIGLGPSIIVFQGPDFEHLTAASDIPMAIHPAFTPSGQLAFSGTAEHGKIQRIYVNGKPISPDGFFANSPVFCNHPEGVRAIFSVGVGKDTDLVSTGEHGGALVRLTQHQGRNGYPACSPDGRLVAFFSTRTSGEGPGLYIMRTDGGRPKRISGMLGDSLRWDPLPPAAQPAASAAPQPSP